MEFITLPPQKNYLSIYKSLYIVIHNSHSQLFMNWLLLKDITLLY